MEATIGYDPLLARLPIWSSGGRELKKFNHGNECICSLFWPENPSAQHRISSVRSKPSRGFSRGVKKGRGSTFVRAYSLDENGLDLFEPGGRNPGISESYRPLTYSKPNATVLEAQGRICTGPTQTRPLNEEKAFKVLETILQSDPGTAGTCIVCEPEDSHGNLIIICLRISLAAYSKGPLPELVKGNLGFYYSR
eukprot:Gb_21097 [translate_table: standard]